MRRKILAFSCLMVLNAQYAGANDCTNQMDVINRNQIVTKGMLDLTLAGKMNNAVADAIGAKSKQAQALMNEGEYQRACDTYDSLIAEYGFKTFEESYYEKYPEKRPENQTSDKPEEAAAKSETMSEAAGDAAVPAAKSDAD